MRIWRTPNRELISAKVRIVQTGRAREAKVSAWKFTRPCAGDLFSAEAEELSLLGPVGRRPRRLAHQCLDGELRGLSAIDDGRGNVGRQPGKPQEGIEVGCRHLLLVSDVMDAQRDAGGNRHPLRQSVPLPWRRRAVLHIERLAGHNKALASLLRCHVRGWTPGPLIS